MPKLSTETAAKVDEADNSFEPLPEGIYNAVLDGEVEVKDGTNGPYWKWTFKITDEGFEGRQQWMNTSLSDKALWKLREVYEAFGYSSDTDTDALIGKPVKLSIVQKIIDGGSRKGDIGNDIRQVLPHNQATTDAPSAATGTRSKARAKAEKDEVPLF